MEAYKNWVRRNKDYVQSLQSLANGFMWFLPESFANSEIGPEAVTAILGLITTVNAHIVDTIPSYIQGGSAGPSPFPYGLCISATKDLECLVEVVAEEIYGDANKWSFIAVIESIKVLVRLALFRNSGYKMLLDGGETPNVEDDMEDSNSQDMSDHLMRIAKLWPGFYKQNPWNLKGKGLSALYSSSENTSVSSIPRWLQRVQHQFAVMNPPSPVVKRPTLSTILSNRGLHGSLFVFGEVLYITRPLVYVLLIRKHGIRSWIPWLLSLAVDLIGAGILSLVTIPWHNREDRRLVLSDSEDDEVKRRKLLWAFYLLRDPFFRKYTSRGLENTEKLMDSIPVIGFITEKIIELIAGMQTRYSYVSGS